MADTTNITNSTNEVKSSIDKLSSSMKNLVALQMAQLTKSSAEYASNIDDASSSFKKLFDLETKHVKQLREENRIEEERIKIEEKLAKLKKTSLASDKAKEQIEKRISELKSKRLESEEDLQKEINKLRKEGLDIDEDDVTSQEELVKFLENRKGILERNLKITKIQSVELEKQIDFYKKHNALVGALHKKWGNVKKFFSKENIFGKLSDATKSWLTQLGSLYSFGRIFEQVKDNINYYRDSMWGLSVSLHGTNDGITRLVGDVAEVNKAFVSASVVAARFGVDSDRVRETMNQLSNKVVFLKKELGETGKLVNRFDASKVGDMTKVMVVFAKTMGMDVSEAVDMYSESIRRFGYSSKQAVKQMSRLQAETLTFNGMLVDFFNSSKKGFNDFENVTVFANEIGRAMAELQQGTRYWVQDLQMMNTQFNTHINLLIKQGKTQKEALALAKNFRKMLTEPTSQLAKYNIGKELRKRYLSAVESAGPNATEQQKREAGALAMGLATKNEKGEVVFENMKMKEIADQLFYLMEIRNKHGRGRDVELTQANIFQDLLGPLKVGTEVAFEYQHGVTKKRDLTVASTQGVGETATEALSMAKLMDELKKYGLENVRDREEAIKLLRTKEFDEFYGGLDEAGKATKELVDSFLKSKESAEWQKAKLEGKTDLTVEQAAMKFREDKIKEAIDGTKEELKNNTKINEENGEIQTDGQGQEHSLMSDIASNVAKIKESIVSKAALGLGAFGASEILSMASLVAQAAMYKKLALPNLGKAIPKSIPTKAPIPTKVPPNVTGSVGNATSKMNWQTFRSQHMDVNRAEAKRLFNQYNKAPIDKSAEKALAKVSETVAKSTSNVAKSVTAVEKSSKAVSTLSKAGLGSKVLSKAGPLGLLATAGIAGYQLSQGDTKGVARTGASTAGAVIGGALGSLAGPVGTVIGSTAGSFIGDFIADSLVSEDAFDKKATFEDFSRVTNSLGLLPENVDKAIEEYASQVQGLSEDSIKDMKESLKEQYKKTYIESQKANTKNPEAILLRKKLEYGNAKQAELTQAQLQQEKEAYEQLDELGKIITNQENLFKLHDKWFNFQVENEVRRLVSDKSLSDKEKKSMLKNMGRGSATGMIQQTRDASGVVTFKVKGNDVVTATGVGMFD